MQKFSVNVHFKYKGVFTNASKLKINMKLSANTTFGQFESTVLERFLTGLCGANNKYRRAHGYEVEGSRGILMLFSKADPSKSILRQFYVCGFTNEDGYTIDTESGHGKVLDSLAYEREAICVEVMVKNIREIDHTRERMREKMGELCTVCVIA